MPDKSFEEQVREELSGLRIKPDDAVWESVAASLQQKRRRRWAIWLLTLLVGLSGASFWFLIEQQEDTSASLPSAHSKISQHIIPKLDIAEIKPSKKNSLPSSEKEIGNTEITIPKKINQSNSVLKPTDLLASTKQKKNTNPKAVTQSSVPEIVVAQSSADIKSEQTELSITSLAKDSAVSIPEIIGNTEQALIGILQYDTIPSLTQEKLSQSSQPQKSSKWTWRVALQAGQSGIRNSWASLFRFNSAGSYGGFFNNNSSPTSPVTGSGSIGSTRIQSKDHFSMGMSIEMTKTFGKKKKNGIGLQLGYDLYQTRTRVGNTNTGTLQFSNVNRSNEAAVYYGVNDSANYIASYHFIRLGVQYYRSLSWISKVDLRWYVGMGVNTMLSGNGLHLGSANNSIYYFRNRSLLQATQLDVTTGFEVALGKSTRLFIAPQAQYMLSNLSKQAGVSQHLFRPSIKFSWQLSKNKP